MAFRFESRESAAEGVRRVARERLTRILNELAQKPAPSADNVHNARKDLKSLRSLLRLIRGSMDPTKRRNENVVFRDAGRMLSQSRDAQVLLDALRRCVKGKTKRSGNQNSSSILYFAEKLETQFTKEINASLPPELLEEIVRQLRSAKRRVHYWLQPAPDAAPSQWETLIGEGLRRTYRQGRELISQYDLVGRENFANESWHELRKNAKTLGYQLRLLRPIWPGPIEGLIDEIDRLGEYLGDDHDLTLVRTRIMDEPYAEMATQDAAEARRALIQSIMRRQNKLKSKSVSLARLVYVESPRRFEDRFATYWRLWHTRSVKPPVRLPSNQPVHPANPQKSRESRSDELIAG
jgi:CHAD domain-containing protein